MPSLISGDSTQFRQGYGDLSWLKRENSQGRSRQPAGVGGSELFLRVLSPCLSYFSCLWLKVTGQDRVLVTDT